MIQKCLRIRFIIAEHYNLEFDEGDSLSLKCNGEILNLSITVMPAIKKFYAKVRGERVDSEFIGVQLVDCRTKFIGGGARGSAGVDWKVIVL
jgi:hypothetical protein